MQRCIELLTPLRPITRPTYISSAVLLVFQACQHCYSGSAHRRAWHPTSSLTHASLKSHHGRVEGSILALYQVPNMPRSHRRDSAALGTFHVNLSPVSRVATSPLRYPALRLGYKDPPPFPPPYHLYRRTSTSDSSTQSLQDGGGGRPLSNPATTTNSRSPRTTSRTR